MWPLSRKPSLAIHLQNEGILHIFSTSCRSMASSSSDKISSGSWKPTTSHQRWTPTLRMVATRLPPSRSPTIASPRSPIFPQEKTPHVSPQVYAPVFGKWIEPKWVKPYTYSYTWMQANTITENHRHRQPETDTTEQPTLRIYCDGRVSNMNDKCCRCVRLDSHRPRIAQTTRNMIPLHI